jgi:hypothetical protein
MPPPRLPGAPRCPFCGAVNDGFTATDEAQAPTEGDIGVCLYCIEVAIYSGEPLRLHRPTPAEAAELREIPDIERLRGLARRARDLRGIEPRGPLQ